MDAARSLTHSRAIFHPFYVPLWGAVGAGIAVIAWPNVPGLPTIHLPGLAAVLLLAWFAAPSRLSAYVLAAGYYLAGTRGLPVGAGVFFARHVTIPGYLLWVAVSLVLAIPYALLWIHPEKRRFWRIALSLVGLFLLQALPWTGFGLIDWISPYLAAASLFPGAGAWAFVWGVGMLLGLCLGMEKRDGMKWIAVVALVALVVGEAVIPSPVRPQPETAQGVNTELGPMPSSLLARYYRNQALAGHVMKSERGYSLTLYPEFVVGVWYQGNAWLYRHVIAQTKTDDHAVLLGVEQPLPGRSAPYLDSLVLIEHGKTRFLPNEISVPYSMWHPWRFHSAKLNLWNPETAKINGRKYGYLICYESLLLWPGLQIAAQSNVNGLMFAANDWWAVNTSIPEIQMESAKLWARILGVHLISAVNT